MAAGRNAFKEGKRQLAHDLWREAATVEPYDEKVWLMLFRVLDNDEDRIVCLENIIAINPMNVQARRRLRAYQEQGAVISEPDFESPTPAQASAKKAAKAKRAAAQPSKKSKQPKLPKAAKAPKTVAQPAATVKRRSGRGAGRTVAIVLLAILLGILVAVALTIILTPR
jgi:hypothetical protein